VLRADVQLPTSPLRHFVGGPIQVVPGVHRRLPAESLSVHRTESRTGRDGRCTGGLRVVQRACQSRPAVRFTCYAASLLSRAWRRSGVARRVLSRLAARRSGRGRTSVDPRACHATTRVWGQTLSGHGGKNVEPSGRIAPVRTARNASRRRFLTGLRPHFRRTAATCCSDPVVVLNVDAVMLPAMPSSSKRRARRTKRVPGGQSRHSGRHR